MLRSFTILMTLLLGLNLSSFAVKFHYCADNLSSISFLQSSNENSGKDKSCSVCTPKHSCCKDVLAIHQATQSHPLNSTVEYKAPVLSVVFTLPSYKPYFLKNLNQEDFVASGEIDDDSNPIYLRHRQLRL